jgi:hypothetical protein
MSEPDATIPEPEKAEAEPEKTEAEHEFQVPIPPPSLELLVLRLKMEAELQLGLLHFGDEKDRPRPDLRLARHTIDLMAVLQEKTQGNLSLEEERLLGNALTELRFRYVQAMEGGKKP